MPPPGCCGCRWWGQAPTLQYICIRGKCHHRFPGNFFVIMILLFQIKKPSFPMGTRTEKTFLRYHLVCRKSGHSARCQHTVCPLTLALRQKILWKIHFPLPSAAHLLPRFSLRSQLPELSVDAHCSFTSASMVLVSSYAFYTIDVCVCQELIFSSDGQMCLVSKNSRAGCPQPAAARWGQRTYRRAANCAARWGNVP